ncbi:MAG: LysR family transcriptional regulator [Polyangiaceae bacterium]|nr:LysR family transcriptional regulator [Polyangiaceae bacterium]
MIMSSTPDDLGELFDRPGLSLERLRSLVRVYDAGGIAAATDSPSEQSQLSRQLGELAQYLGLPVTRRQGRNVRLTEEGAELARLAREFLRSVAGLRHRASPDAPLGLTVAAGDSVLSGLVVPAIARVLAALPRLVPTLEAVPAENPYELLVSARAHAVIARERPRRREHEAQAIGEWDCRLYAPRALVPRGASAREVLRAVPLALQVSEVGFERKVLHAAAAHGLALRPALRCETFAQARAAVAVGYAAVLPVLLGATLGRDAVEVPTEGGEIGAHVATLWLAHDKRLPAQLPRTHQALVALASQMRHLTAEAARAGGARR